MARGWWCVNTSKACAPRLGAIVEQTGRSVGFYGDVYHTLARPVLPFEHEAVRALELAGLAMLDANEYRVLKRAVASRKIAAGKARRAKIGLLSNQGLTARERTLYPPNSTFR
jgi:hypothetical protein